jgi:hypothetical protein
MAFRKIIIEFTENPSVGNAFSYEIDVLGSPFLYPNGFTTLNLDFVSGSDVAYESISIKSTLTDTINNTLNFLTTYYSSPYIGYSKMGDSIEVLLNFNDAVVTYPYEPSDSILISDDAYSPDVNYKLKYLVQWVDTEGFDYSVRIYKKGYTGSSTSVSGYAVLNYGSVNNNLDAVRGNGLDLSLNATTDLTLEDLYTEDENSFSVKMYRKNKLLFDGFLKPDGVYQSFVQDQWILNLSCVDGLGLLQDLAFVQSNGLQWIGKQRAIDVIYNCLQRTELQMNINTSVNIYYNGLTPSDTLDPLHEVHVSVNRFVKDDNDTIMNCNEVLTSILNLFNAVICQNNGQWYIYKPNEIYANSIVKFRQYSETNNTYIKLNTINLGFNLGSQVNNYYPHHSGGNQQIQIKGSVSAVRLNYKYGFVKSLNANPNLTHTEKVYPGWTVINDAYVIIDPLKTQGLISAVVIPSGMFPTVYPIMYSDDVALIAGDTIKVALRGTLTGSSQQANAKFRVTLTQSSGAVSYMRLNGTWSATEEFIVLGMNPNFDITIQSQALPASGDISLTIFQALQTFSGTGNYELTFADVQNSATASSAGAVGEFHSVQRQNRPSSISKDTITIYNGDSPSLIYEGAIYEDDDTVPTSTWFRKGKTENKPILQIAVEDILRAQQKPQKVFSGDIYGFMPYLSIVNIDNLEGKFMPIEWSFNALTNVTSVKLLEIFANELTDIDYTYALDYGNTTKVTITS